MYYHIPSEATTKNLSYGVIARSKIYGTAFVPALIPALSPKERVIARPGIWAWAIQTLRGPSY